MCDYCEETVVNLIALGACYGEVDRPLVRPAEMRVPREEFLQEAQKRSKVKKGTSLIMHPAVSPPPPPSFLG